MMTERNNISHVNQANEFCLVTTTSDSRERLVQIARQLVQERLAACCQIIGPHTSIYRWEGETEEATEWMCLIKTATHRYAAVEQTIRERHSYQTPEIIVTPITAGSEDYLNWMTSALESPTNERT